MKGGEGGVCESGSVEEGCDCTDCGGYSGGCRAGVVLDAAAEGYVLESEGCGGEIGRV